jgi:hypothetical protein
MHDPFEICVSGFCSLSIIPVIRKIFCMVGDEWTNEFESHSVEE